MQKYSTGKNIFADNPLCWNVFAHEHGWKILCNIQYSVCTLKIHFCSISIYVCKYISSLLLMYIEVVSPKWQINIFSHLLLVFSRHADNFGLICTDFDSCRFLPPLQYNGEKCDWNSGAHRVGKCHLKNSTIQAMCLSMFSVLVTLHDLQNGAVKRFSGGCLCGWR